MAANLPDYSTDKTMKFYASHAFSFIGNVRRHYRMLLVFLATALVLAIGLLYVMQPQYTAVAIVGPQSDNLDMDGYAGGMGGLGGGLTAAIGGKGLAALAGGLGGRGSVFDQYTELLTSNELAAKLAQDPKVLQSIFYKRYDWDKHQWKRHPEIIGDVIDFAKTVIHYPIKDKPDQNDVMKFLDKDVNVDAPLTSAFVTVSLKAKDPKEAEWLLNTLLADADTIIRADRRRVVSARIAYLSNVLPQLTQSDQRNTLISLLSMQEQSMMMIAADRRYASALIDSSHADLVPTSPSPFLVIVMTLLAAFGSWAALVYRLPANHWFLELFTGAGKWRVLWTRPRVHVHADKQL